MAEDNILELKGITKYFPGVKALDDVSFSVRRGEVHALMGENGAGKSTIIKIVVGVYRHDGGTIVLDGKEVSFKSAQESQQAGIGCVYQELNMVPYLTVSENIFLGHLPMKGKSVDWKTMHENAKSVMLDLGIDIDVRKKLNEFGTATAQMISIARCLQMNSKLVILDEPTSSLDTKEVDRLVEIVHNLRDKGISVIFITHRLDEVYRMCDRITVLKDGTYQGTYLTSELPMRELIDKMVGGKAAVGGERVKRDKYDPNAEVLLEVRNLTRAPYVNEVSFKVRKGEIFGLAGLLGAGRTEIVRMIFGLDHGSKGEIYLEGKKVNIHSSGDAIRNGIAFCTENRREEGIIPNMSVEGNINLVILKELSNRLQVLNRKRMGDVCEEYRKEFAIKIASPSQKIANLSGGNQQKALLARWMATKPRLLILDEPTRGIDVGAKREIEQMMRSLADSGLSVIFISSEMSEMTRNCDRIAVIRDGKVMGELTDNEGVTEEAVYDLIAHGAGTVAG